MPRLVISSCGCFLGFFFKLEIVKFYVLLLLIFVSEADLCWRTVTPGPPARPGLPAPARHTAPLLVSPKRCFSVDVLIK